MKLLSLLKNNIFLVFTLFLVAFIPLYPKIPLIGLTHVNVYVRAEDFIVLLFVIIYLIQVIRKKESFKTPLTIAIFAFWLTGFISTLLGLIYIFPHLNDPTITGDPRIYSRNALLFYARHIEYMSLFFIAYAAIKDKKSIKFFIPIIVGVFLTVVLYGFGQRFIPQRFPAFSTMNEEFAKGIPLVLDAAGRLQSTFAGHYDFGAYLVMLIPLIGSLIFGYKNWFGRFGLLIISVLGFITLLMTQSRTSFLMYLLAVIFMLILQKQKKWIIPVVIISFVMLRTFTGLYARYSATFSSVNRIVDARTGKVIGYGDSVNGKFVINNVQPSGPDLYAGSLSTNAKKIGNTKNVIINTQKGTAKSIDVQNLQGDFIIQKASALDASITTRLQAEWPNAIKAFKRNIFFGSGYSSITLATDGNYFRFLGETGLMGFGLFSLIFLIYAIYFAKIMPLIEDKLTRSFVIGVTAGIFGLWLNASLIDVFEASKISYTLWILVGLTIGILVQYRKKSIDLIHEIKDMLFSVPAIFIYFGVTALIFFWEMLNHFFVADDFTWIKWVSDCKQLTQGGVANCSSKFNILSNFFFNSSEFFYRPGMKTYFYILYNSQFGGISPVVYHLVSLSLHVAITILIFLITQKILKDKLLSFVTAFIFLLLASHAETIFWISAVGHLFATFFTMLSFWLYLKWKEGKKNLYLIISVLFSFVAPLFHEYGVITPILVVSYGIVSSKLVNKQLVNKHYIFYVASLILYFFMKLISNSFWSAGDYKYNLLKLPFNFFGNAISSLGYIFVGSPFLQVNEFMRSSLRTNMVFAFVVIAVFSYLAVYIFKKNIRHIKKHDKDIIVISLLFFIIPLLPFLGLGNIAPRYTYLASFGAILFVVFVFQKIYAYLKSFNKIFAVIVIWAIPAFFLIFQYNQLQKENRDWRIAGLITNNFLQYMNDGYEDMKLGVIKKPIFYFVNVPQRYKNAWIFPVGVQDATWFTYKENNLVTRSSSSIEQAKKEIGNNPSGRVFEFDKDGNLKLIK
ncbi:MAG TPA: O-antigen ligase family protein [Candidatus Limnocylindrales bacterium]|nr:O-antigen ligase family protein [Candidatus Limnocylindrales bacterium]